MMNYEGAYLLTMAIVVLLIVIDFILNRQVRK